MSGVNEEDYLDNLLKSISEDSSTDNEPKESLEEIEEREIKEQVQEALSKANDADENVEVFDEPEDVDTFEEADSAEDADAFDIAALLAETESMEDLENTEEPALTPEEVAKKAQTGAAEDVKDIVLDKEVSEDDLQRNDEELDAHINQMLDETDVSDVEKLKKAAIPEDDSIAEQLSPSELERLVNMNLDDIIEDATAAETVSVDELFGKPVEEPAGEHISGADAVHNDGEVQSDDGDISAAEALGMQAGADEAENGKAEGKAKKKKKKTAKVEAPLKGKKPKKSIFTLVKNIFFESLEDKELEEAGKEDGASSELQSDAGDENQQIINEVYQGKEHLDDAAAPKKGFVAKLKYRWEQRKLKAAEEDQLEQEAEALDAEEKKKQKEEKKLAAQENKENKKKAKAEKPKKEKKPKAAKPKKAKKPKKEKEPPKPGDILKIKPLSMLFFILFIAGIVVLILVMNMSVHHGNSVANARSYYTLGDYEKAYDSLSGVSLSKSEQTLYDQVATLMYVQRHYESYENYRKLNMNTEALNALIKGLDRYNEYINEARDLGVADKMEEIRNSILQAMQDTFKLSETEADNLRVMSDTDFTNYYITIEAYGEAAQ